MHGAGLCARTVALLKRPTSTHVAILAQALTIGLVLRAGLVVVSDFPPGSGGLFYVITRDIQRCHFALPRHISYNSAGLPLMQPPLAFYLAAVLDLVAPGDLLGVLRFLPLAVSALTMAAFWLLSCSILGSRVTAALATLAFALLPDGIAWSAQATGLPRSLGLLFGILATREACLLHATGARKHIFAATTLLVCAVLSHTEAAVFAVCSVALVAATIGRTRRSLVYYMPVAVGTTAATAPWWVTIMARHGVSTVLAVDQLGWTWSGGIGELLSLNISGEPLFPLFGSLAIVGVFACLARKEFRAPAYLVAAFAVVPQAPSLATTVPLSMLSGIGTQWLLTRRWARRPSRGASSSQLAQSDAVQLSPSAHRRLRRSVMAVIVLYGTLVAGVSQQLTVGSVPAQEREAMEWVAANTPEQSRFLVVTPESPERAYRSLEWFPALTGRASLTTVHGTQWLGGDEFQRRVDQLQSLPEAAAEGADGLEKWAAMQGNRFTHICVLKPIGRDDMEDCDLWRLLLRRLAADPEYSLVYDGPGAAIYARVSTARPGPNAP